MSGPGESIWGCCSGRWRLGSGSLRRLSTTGSGDHAEPEVGYYPALIKFLGYNPLPGPKTLGQAVRQKRMTRGWSVARLAREAGVDPATVARLERECARMAQRPVAAITGALGIPLDQQGSVALVPP